MKEVPITENKIIFILFYTIEIQSHSSTQMFMYF